MAPKRAAVSRRTRPREKRRPARATPRFSVPGTGELAARFMRPLYSDTTSNPPPTRAASDRPKVSRSSWRAATTGSPTIATPALATQRSRATVLPMRNDAKKSVVSWPSPDSFEAFGNRVAKRRPMAGRPRPSFSSRSLVAMTMSSTAVVVVPSNDRLDASGPAPRSVTRNCRYGLPSIWISAIGPTPTLMPIVGPDTRSPRSPDTGNEMWRIQSTPVSSSTCPAPTVCGSSVTNGRCCAPARAAASTPTSASRPTRPNRTLRPPTTITLLHRHAVAPPSPGSETPARRNRRAR